MIKFRGKDKNELLVLTGAIYSFVAYLMAFTLEVLFLIDLARRTSEFLASTSPISNPDESLDFDSTTSSAQQVADNNNNNDNNQQLSALVNGFNFDAMQTHRTISCLAIAILYFIVFIASLILIVALILRSTFMLLIWMCAMATMYLPEFGLVVYVSVYSWGLGTRNGQTELVFYLFRAILNLLFIFKAHRLFKQWSYEKNFYRLKSSSQFTGYDSPYFIGDSLTTTINPVFSPASTLHNSPSSRYDRVRDSQTQSPASNSIFSLTNAHNNNNNSTMDHQQFDYPSPSRSGANDQRLDYRGNRLVATGGLMYSREFNVKGLGSGSKFRTNYDNFNQSSSESTTTTASPKRKQHDFFIGDAFQVSDQERRRSGAQNHQHADYNQRLRQQQQQQQSKNPSRLNSTSSMLSINDDFPEYELDLDYRTLTQSRNNHSEQTPQPPSRHHNYSNQRFHQPHHHHHHNHHQQQQQYDLHRQQENMMSSKSPDSLSYSTQSLDRRHLRDIALPDQVILRPLGHQPFEYLHRPGSSSNINSLSNLNTQPSSLYSSHAKLTKRSEHDLSHRRF